MASVMRASTSAYKPGMSWWSYGGLNLVGIGIFTSFHRCRVRWADQHPSGGRGVGARVLYSNVPIWYIHVCMCVCNMCACVCVCDGSRLAGATAVRSRRSLAGRARFNHV